MVTRDRYFEEFEDRYEFTDRFDIENRNRKNRDCDYDDDDDNYDEYEEGQEDDLW